MVKKISKFIDILKERNILKDTNFFGKKNINTKKDKIFGYVGFDPTAKYIHFGNY